MISPRRGELSGRARAYASAGQAEPALTQARRAVEMARSGPDEVRWASLRSLALIERRDWQHRNVILHGAHTLHASHEAADVVLLERHCHLAREHGDAVVV